MTTYTAGNRVVKYIKTIRRKGPPGYSQIAAMARGKGDLTYVERRSRTIKQEKTPGTV